MTHIKSQRMKKELCHGNINQKKATRSIVISDKVVFRAKSITRDKKGHFIMLNKSIFQKDITILNIYALNNKKASSYLKQRRVKVQVLVRDLNTVLIRTDPSRHKSVKI